MSDETRRRGWCPGALRPMQSGDGLLVRLKPSYGLLSLDQVDAIAALSRAHGNGIVELTSRGNLQLRGVRAETLDRLTEGLDALGVIDGSAEAEAVRNVISTPLAGVDVSAYDTRTIVTALERRLASEAPLRGLSDKFGFLVDGGGLLSLADVEADVRFAWRENAFAVGVAREAGCDWIGRCMPEDVAEIGIAIALGFLRAGDGARRMRGVSDAARRLIVEAASDGVGLRASPHGADPTGNVVGGDGRSRCVGLVRADAGGGDVVAVGLGLAYGGTTAEALGGLAALARVAGSAELRLTPWRAVLIPVADAESAANLLSRSAALGFIADSNDPRRAIAACPGAPACSSGSSAVRADADRFAEAAAAVFGEGISLHVSGCAKGCARRQAATLTFVAEDGRYGLVVNGPASAPAFGRFTAYEAAETLARLASAMTKAGGACGASCETAAIEAALQEIKAA